MENNKIDLALLEAIYISRWNETKTALQAVLTVEESEQIVDNIKFELSKVLSQTNLNLDYLIENVIITFYLLYILIFIN